MTARTMAAARRRSRMTAVALAQAATRRRGPRTRSPTPSICPTISSATTGASRWSGSPRSRSTRARSRAASTSRSRTPRTPSRRRSTRSTTSSAQKPDAILVDAASDAALNPTIKKACDAGIVVISFDQVVTEPCAYAARLRLGPHPGGAGRVDGQAARRQGQRHRRPRPRRRADLGAAAERLRDGAGQISRHQGGRLLQRRICARAGAVRRRGAARRQSRRSTAS